MQFFKYSTLLIFLILIVNLSGCSCNCGKSNEENYVKGFITVVGDEVHTYVAIQTDENKTYILKCSKELNDILIKNQGTYYYIQYDELTKVDNVDAVIVKKAIPSKKESK